MLRHSAKKQLFKIGNLPKVKQINLKRSNCEKPQLDFENLSNLTWLSSTSHKLYMSRSKRYALKNVFAKLCDCRLWRLKRLIIPTNYSQFKGKICKGWRQLCATTFQKSHLWIFLSKLGKRADPLIRFLIRIIGNAMLCFWLPVFQQFLSDSC